MEGTLSKRISDILDSLGGECRNAYLCIINKGGSHRHVSNVEDFLEDNGIDSETIEPLVDSNLVLKTYYEGAVAITDPYIVDALEYSKNKNKGKGYRFRKPTIEEVAEYCKQRMNNVDPDAFYYYYESNGWMVGKFSMKNWKAAVITWEKNIKRYSYVNGKKPRDVVGISMRNEDIKYVGDEDLWK